MARREHFDAGQGKKADSCDCGGQCADCSNDMGDFYEWEDLKDAHPDSVVPCVTCGKKPTDS